MKNLRKMVVLTALVAILAAGITNAGTIIDNHVGEPGIPTLWTKAGSPYHLQGDIYVLPGEELTIEAGTVIASFVNDSQSEEEHGESSLIVCRDAKIFILGTQAEPVIFTSAEDVATWTGSQIVRDGIARDRYPDGFVTDIVVMGNSKTGVWRPVSNEWGNLTVLGNGYISSTYNQASNVPYPSGSNTDVMEGLVAGGSITDDMTRYGGDDDDDDSGIIRYVSLRYGGREIGSTNELNGLSLGGVGRGTDISHVEIMNNLDDGIEIWGGTVNLSYVSIWNIGDDSLDIDQGWRGTANYGIIVQGYGIGGDSPKSGSGIGDNCFEIDGAENADAQPVLTVRISNFTTIGDPYGGDHATAWRDGARVQFDNCIFMDIGKDLVKNDGSDGDSAGYGHNGTLTFEEVWSTPYDAMWDINNLKTGGHSSLNGLGLSSQDKIDFLQTLYHVQTSGNLSQITNSVFHNIVGSYATAINVGVLADDTTMDAPNGIMDNIISSTLPIREIIRAEPVLVGGGRVMAPVQYLNPLPASGVTAGAFSNCNWLAGWTSADAYGMTDTSMNGASADLNCDGKIDLLDFAHFSTQWLQ